MEGCFTEFHPNEWINLDATDRNSFSWYSKERLSLSRFPRNSSLLPQIRFSQNVRFQKNRFSRKSHLVSQNRFSRNSSVLPQNRFSKHARFHKNRFSRKSHIVSQNRFSRNSSLLPQNLFSQNPPCHKTDCYEIHSYSRRSDFHETRACSISFRKELLYIIS